MCSPKKSKSSTSDTKEPRPPDDSHRRDTSPPSPTSQLPVTTSIGDVTSSPTGILDYVIGTRVNPHTSAAGEILGQTAASSDNQEPDQKPQPPDESRPEVTPPPSGSQLPVTFSVGVTSSPTGILDSVIGSGVNPHNRAAGDILGRTAAAAGTAYIDELRPPGTAKGSTEFYEVCTESLGYESMSETMDLYKERSSRLLISSLTETKMCGVMRDKRRSKVFPPNLSSLDNSGRPRFSFEKVRGGGRLNIVKVDHNADLVGGGRWGGGEVAQRRVVMRRDHQEDDDGNCDDETKNDDPEMIGDRQDVDGDDGNSKEEEMAGDDHQEEMIGELDQGGDDDNNDVNQVVEVADQDDDGKNGNKKKKGRRMKKKKKNKKKGKKKI